jgi:hypothetical protein
MPAHVGSSQEPAKTLQQLPLQCIFFKDFLYAVLKNQRDKKGSEVSGCSTAP